jgi:hypothetical protein
MDKEKRHLVGICGIYCGSCPKYLAPREGDQAMVERICRESGLGTEEIRCDGCLSDRVFPSCRDCKPGFRRCATEHGVTWCFECSDFPCRRLEEFREVHIVNGISHHRFLNEELSFMRDHGVEEWLEIQDAKSRCSFCGARVYWSSRTCRNCGSPRHVSERYLVE